MRTPAGELPDRVTIQERTGSATNDSGQPKPEWADREDRWARVDDLSAGLMYRAAAAGVRAKVMVTMALPLAIVEFRNRIVWRRPGHAERVLEIVDVRVEGARRRTTVEVFCDEARPAPGTV